MSKERKHDIRAAILKSIKDYKKEYKKDFNSTLSLSQELMNEAENVENFITLVPDEKYPMRIFGIRVLVHTERDISIWASELIGHPKNSKDVIEFITVTDMRKSIIYNYEEIKE